MEDAHSAVLGIPDQKETVCWFAVFDGHAGSRVSAHCSHHLLDCIRYHKHHVLQCLVSLICSISSRYKYFYHAGPRMTSHAACSRSTRFLKRK